MGERWFFAFPNICFGLLESTLDPPFDESCCQDLLFHRKHCSQEWWGHHRCDSTRLRQRRGVPHLQVRAMYNSAINCSEGATLHILSVFFDEIKDFDKEIRAQSINTPKLEIGMVGTWQEEEQVCFSSPLCLVHCSVFYQLRSSMLNKKHTSNHQTCFKDSQLETTGSIKQPNNCRSYRFQCARCLWLQRCWSLNQQQIRCEQNHWLGLRSSKEHSLERAIFDLEGTPTGETINRNQFTTYFALPFLDMLNNRSNVSDMNYLVTSKGMPLRVSGGQNKASFDQEFACLVGHTTVALVVIIGRHTRMAHFLVENLNRFRDKNMDFISLHDHWIYRWYSIKSHRKGASLGKRTYVLIGYKQTVQQQLNDDLYVANTTITELYNESVYFDEETNFVTNVSNVIGYASWGSNDGNWVQIKNSGFETEDTTWSRVFDIECNNTNIIICDSFAWDFRPMSKRSAAPIEATISASCSDESSNGTQASLQSFSIMKVWANTARCFAHWPCSGTHANRNFSPVRFMNSAYPGLDDRFKNNWGSF